jgi:GntR family transcriptional regulator, histidine utilization repressor
MDNLDKPKVTRLQRTQRAGSATRKKTSKVTRVRSSKRIPMHQQIRKYILQKIRNGKWRPEDRIPSEHELTRKFRVSRMTVLQAVRDLCKDGLLTRQQGSGTFVAQPRTHLTVVNITDIAQEIRDRNHQHAARVIERARREGTVAESKQFNLKNGSEIFCTMILHYEDELPVQLEERLVNPSAAPDFLDIDYSKTTSFSYLMRLFPYPAGQHVIRTVEPSARIKQLLRLQAGEPCLVIERTTWVAQTVVTIVRLLHPGFRYEIKGTIERQ